VDENLKKSLIIIMKRTTMPIEITSAYTISMNLDSFVGVSIKNIKYTIEVDFCKRSWI